MFQLPRWPYIRPIALSGDLQADVTRLLTENGKPETAGHCMTVASTIQTLAARFGLDRDTAVRSALVHDIGAIMKPQDMLAYAVEQAWDIDPSERKHPFLLHQRVSAEIAKALFQIHDPAVLSAVACHTTLKADPSDTDMALFLSDKLSWDQKGTPPYYSVVSSALKRSLSCASHAYIRFVLEHGMVLSPHRWLLDAKRWLDERC